MMGDLAVRDWLQLATLVFVAGVFVQQARSTSGKVDQHEKRLSSVESLAQTSSALLARATNTLDRINERLDEHEKNSPCAEHTTLLEVFREELGRVRNERGMA